MWCTSKRTLYFYKSTIIRPNTERNDTDLVYNFYKIATEVAESEKRDTWRDFKVGPRASKAIYTTLSSLNEICF
jgi:hypothetical protein